MSNLKNMPQDLEKKLLEVKTPHIRTPQHKVLLKRALQQSRCFQKHKAFLGDSSIFTYIKTMSQKNIVPIGLIGLFVFILIGQSYMASRNMVYAQSLLDQAIQKVSQASPETDKEKDLQSTLIILDQLRKNGELTYIGEEVQPAVPEYQIPETHLKKFSFSDADLSSEVIIFVDEVKPDVFMLKAPDMGIDEINISVEEGLNGEIANLEDLKQKLRDPNLTKPWLKTLVQRNNVGWLKKMEQIAERRWQTFASDEQIDFAAEPDGHCLKVFNELVTVIPDIDVLITGWGFGGNGELNSDHCYLSIYSIAGQQERNSAAQEQIQNAINKLQQFDTDSARMKIEILKKAFTSKHLKSASVGAPNAFLSFPYPGVNANFDIRISFDDLTESFVEMRFTSGRTPISHLDGDNWIDVEIEGGHIANREELQKKLQDPNLHDDLLQFIAKSQNLDFAHSIQKYEVDEIPGLTRQIADELEELLSNAQVAIVGWSEVSFGIPELDEKVSKYGKGKLLFFMNTYPLSKIPPTDAVQVLNGVIDKLKVSANSGKQVKIDFLKSIQTAQDLHYEGEETLGDGRKMQKISFTLEGKKTQILLEEDGTGYQLIE